MNLCFVAVYCLFIFPFQLHILFLFCFMTFLSTSNYICKLSFLFSSSCHHLLFSILYSIHHILFIILNHIHPIHPIHPIPSATSYFPDGRVVGTGSDDSTCRLFDLRADCELNSYGDTDIVSGVTAIGFSHSGRLLFASYEDKGCFAWDVLKGTKAASLPHDARVSCMGVTGDGYAVATGAWDALVRVWA